MDKSTSPSKGAPAAKRLDLLRRRKEQAADAPKAMAEYRAAQQAAIDRMHQLRALRLARDAGMTRADRDVGGDRVAPRDAGRHVVAPGGGVGA